MLCLFASTAVLFAQEPVRGRTDASKAAPGEAFTRRAVTVAQFTDAVGAAKNNSDDEAASEIEHLELTERLSSTKLAALYGELPGAKSKAALMAVGDGSVFLDPPPSEMLAKAAPSAEDQRQIVSRASDYLTKIIPRLPDFYARRITTAFKVLWTPKDKQGTHEPGALALRGRFQAKVLYRNGKEVVRAEGAEEVNLITRGTFGPILSIVIQDNLRSPMQWHGWEEGPDGPMAVLQFEVPHQKSHYQVSFGGPSLGGAGGRAAGYRGEIGIDPETGTILRLVLQSDPVLGPRFVGHADLMLEYGPVVIGGKTYTCPVRGVSRSTATYQQVGIIGHHRAFILLDDVVFTDYHVFRSEMRILPD
jgi:hypothetical protein